MPCGKKKRRHPGIMRVLNKLHNRITDEIPPDCRRECTAGTRDFILNMIEDEIKLRRKL